MRRRILDSLSRWSVFTTVFRFGSAHMILSFGGYALRERGYWATGEWVSRVIFVLDLPVSLPATMFASPREFNYTPTLIILFGGTGWWIYVGLLLRRFAVVRLDRECGIKGIHECTVCNYNLTGNTSGICPECGTPCKPFGGAAREDSQE